MMTPADLVAAMHLAQVALSGGNPSEFIEAVRDRYAPSLGDTDLLELARAFETFGAIVRREAEDVPTVRVPR